MDIEILLKGIKCSKTKDHYLAIATAQRDNDGVMKITRRDCTSCTYAVCGFNLTYKLGGSQGRFGCWLMPIDMAIVAAEPLCEFSFTGNDPNAASQTVFSYDGSNIEVSTDFTNTTFFSTSSLTLPITGEGKLLIRDLISAERLANATEK